MVSFAQIAKGLGLVIFTGLIIYAITLFAPFYMIFPFADYSSGRCLLLWSEFIFVLFITLFTAIKILKWRSITCWLFIVVLIVIAFICFNHLLPITADDIMWNSNHKSAWAVARFFASLQGILLLLYCSLLPFHRYTSKIDGFILKRRSLLGNNRYEGKIVVLWNKATNYVKARKYRHFILCEILAFLLLLSSWIFGFNPILIIAMVAIDFASEIVFYGNIILMSLVTMFLSHRLLQMSRWHIWGISQILCTIAELLIMNRIILDIEYIVINYGILFFFSSSLIISQIILIMTYCFINFIMPKKRIDV